MFELESFLSAWQEAVLGEFGCRGYDTFGPFRLVGGIAKGRPDARDLENARAFYRGLRELCERGAHT